MSTSVFKPHALNWCQVGFHIHIHILFSLGSALAFGIWCANLNRSCISADKTCTYELELRKRIAKIKDFICIGHLRAFSPCITMNTNMTSNLTQIRNIKMAKRDFIDHKLSFWRPHWPYSNQVHQISYFPLSYIIYTILGLSKVAKRPTRVNALGSID